MNVAYTGGSGFVGKRFISYNQQKWNLVPINLRQADLSQLNLDNIDAIVHLAGKAHQMTPIADQVYFDVNYTLTKQLVERAIECNVPHFIYISSTKVYGDDIAVVLNEKSACHPTDAYGESKLKAEQFLEELTEIKVAIVRPPLVYGPEVKGNMIKLLHLANKRLPLPLGNINNARSMVFIDNLVELINTIILKKATGIYIAGDEKPISSDGLIKLMRKYLNNHSMLISIPLFARSIIRKIKPALYVRLFGSYVIDNSSGNKALNFVPPFSTEYGVQKMVEWFKKQPK